MFILHDALPPQRVSFPDICGMTRSIPVVSARSRPSFSDVAGDAPYTFVKVETSAEIVAKKMWHRGDRPTARDLFDLCLVIACEAESLMAAGVFLVRHRDTFLRLLHERRAFVRARFDDIQTLGYSPSFDYCVELAEAFLQKLPNDAPEQKSRRR
ncbi:nucleotidyl transferase AbiEii/AbiGii toxin family protein [Burkholderia contaminans]|uniref:nucleotidyl transferase AbiEii/AbiGii toxin family protein n=1 Tax=Burkholderia contaminans TaxID=488447 RepID=UPI001CF330E7|nr:nucleotidyl transferase AbiEii/AbiGii toxin family protein [Burkholderia contaminans]MCA7915860.1 nucleotidyl transferase AbiEii/AbiGii toxin family protein [Burkholderia contaminans]UUX40742.1 nucleotidyl transferase AbiEii/AbiGii toxin family protein [Burkholderia contaminans]